MSEYKTVAQKEENYPTVDQQQLFSKRSQITLSILLWFEENHITKVLITKCELLEKLQKDLNNNSPPLGYRLNSRGSKANSQQAPMHWLREITKAKLSQARFG